MAQAKAYPVRKFIIIALFCAIMCIIAPISIPLPISPVPISLSLAIVLLTSYILIPTDAITSIIIWILLGLVGLPVFSGFTGGLSKLIGPTGGYIIGFIPTAWFCSFMIRHVCNSFISHFIIMLISTIICYAIGTIWFIILQDVSVGAALAMCVIPFIPADIIKMIIVMIIGPKLVDRIRIS